MDTKNAPKAAGRFIELAKSGFYDGLTFHRVVPGFVIQGGDPNGDGSGGTGESVVGETPKDGYPVGSVAAAKLDTDPAGTFDCQFFIVTGENGTQLPPDYARFAKVIAGMDTVKRIEALGSGDGPPSGAVRMNKVTVTEPSQ
jgi:cyclophilin family peptidyl-prolyl cis-trans isomerase